MLALADCLAFCDLDEAEINAIADHEGVPLIVALEEGEALLHRFGGVTEIATMIYDEMTSALEGGDVTKAKYLRQTYDHFLNAHVRA